MIEYSKYDAVNVQCSTCKKIKNNISFKLQKESLTSINAGTPLSYKINQNAELQLEAVKKLSNDLKMDAKSHSFQYVNKNLL